MTTLCITFMWEKSMSLSNTTALKALPKTVSTTSALSDVMKALDSTKLCIGNQHNKYHTLQGWKKGSFFDQVGKLMIGARSRSPHTCELAGRFSIRTVRTWFRISTSCPICAWCILHVLLHKTRQETGLAGQKSWTVGANVTGTWKRWGKGGTTSKTETEY